MRASIESPAPVVADVPRVGRGRMSLGAYRKLTAATAGSIWLVIVLGGLVRVTESGTGCGSSWPMCHGRLLPELEYHQLIEWNHRLFATLVGLLMAATVLSTLVWYRKPRRLLLLALVAAAAYLGQAALGGITVLLHLDHTWVAAHMGNSMVLLGAALLLAMSARLPEGASFARLWRRARGDGAQPQTGRESGAHKSTYAMRLLSLGTLVTTFAAMLTGSAVVGADANVACPAWPQCSDSNLLPVTAAEWINFGHRVAVGLSDVLIVVLAVLVWRSRRFDRKLMVSAHVLALLYVGQVFVGAFTIWLGAPEALKGVHLALAAATWGALVVLTAYVWVEGAASAEGGGKPSSAGGLLGGLRRATREVVPERVRMFASLTRPHVIPLLLVPTAASMLIAAVRYPPERSLLELLALTMLGGTLTAGGAHAINQYLDRDIDARMKRTSRRPVVTGRISPRAALWFGLALSVVGVCQLWLTVNTPAALLSLFGSLFYVLVYTVWLKRTSVQNIVIGGAAGAVPPLVGWAAVTGRVDIPALLFFAIIFFWTPAHFWALALVRQEEYREAGVPMLPVVRGEAATRAGILRYTLLLAVVSLLPFAVQALGWLYLLTALVLGGLFVRGAVRLARERSPVVAWRLFKFSNSYLALLYAAMVLDRLLALGGVALR